MLAGEEGPARQFAMQQIVRVGEFYDAADCVEISQVHLMADPEATGEEGIAFLEQLAELPDKQRHVRVPTVTDPRGVDFKAYSKLRQSKDQVDLEKRLSAAFEKLDIMLTNTCINYQTIMPPVLGEHVAFGDTGSSIYANSVQGARTNFEGGPSALAAALTGRTPRYGFHLDDHRRGKALFEFSFQARDLSDWGAMGALVGQQMSSYWDVPVIQGIDKTPGSDELKQFGAALASYGSTPLFHMIGVTPEAPDLKSVFDTQPPDPTGFYKSDLNTFLKSYWPDDAQLDVVVFAAPQLSLMELKSLADLLRGREIHSDVALLAATSPEIKSAADRMGVTKSIEDSGGLLLEGVCFYQMYAREIGEANKWRRLMSNSAKLVNILGGYGYEPMLASMENCVESAIAGKIVGGPAS